MYRDAVTDPTPGPNVRKKVEQFSSAEHMVISRDHMAVTDERGQKESQQEDCKESEEEEGWAICLTKTSVDTSGPPPILQSSSRAICCCVWDSSNPGSFDVVVAQEPRQCG